MNTNLLCGEYIRFFILLTERIDYVFSRFLCFYLLAAFEKWFFVSIFLLHLKKSISELIKPSGSFLSAASWILFVITSA